MMNAQKMLRDARKNAGMRKRVGVARYGNVVVLAERSGRFWRYNVGTDATCHAMGRPSDVLPVLEAMLEVQEARA